MRGKGHPGNVILFRMKLASIRQRGASDKVYFPPNLCTHFGSKTKWVSLYWSGVCYCYLRFIKVRRFKLVCWFFLKALEIYIAFGVLYFIWIILLLSIVVDSLVYISRFSVTDTRAVTMLQYKKLQSVILTTQQSAVCANTNTIELTISRFIY